MEAVRAEKVNFKYRENGEFALRDINVSFEEGKIHVLAGPNGAGKTTLLKLTAGILSGFSGKVALAGKNARKYTEKEKARIVSYIPQAESFIFDFTVYEIAAMGRRPYTGPFGRLSAKDKEEVFSALESFGLSGKFYRKYNSLSGGERRSVFLARALAQDAKILLMDEPGTYLDISHTGAMMGKLSRLAKQGRTIIIISHDLNASSVYADNFVFMKGGEIVFSGRPEEAITKTNIKDIYGAEDIMVEKNPVTGKPAVFHIGG